MDGIILFMENVEGISQLNILDSPDLDYALQKGVKCIVLGSAGLTGLGGWIRF